MDKVKYKIEGINEEGTYVGETKLPPPPKPGEYMICQLCQEPMLPNEISKDPKIRKRELKWHIHNKCHMSVDDILDRTTPKLMATRYGNKGSFHNLVKEEMTKKK